MALEHLAFLLMPAEAPSWGVLIEAGDDWRLELPTDRQATVVVWGRGPLPFGTELAAAARFAGRRERALRRLRAGGPKPWTETGIHRLSPSPLRAGPVRHAVRSALFGGALVDLSPPDGPTRVFDAVADAALGGSQRAAPLTRRFHPGSGGAALIRLPGERGPLIVRAAPQGSPPDPVRNAAALAALETVVDPALPRPLGSGVRAGASWSAETGLPGGRARRATQPILDQLAALCARLPRASGPPTATAEDLRTVAARLPQTSESVAGTGRWIEGELASAPSILRHGDLWTGNLLVKGDMLTGVVDWDSWHPAGVPGSDLLHVVGMAEAGRTGRSLGETWLRRPWDSALYGRVAERYWRAVGWKPTGPQLKAIGVAWWAGHVANALVRIPGLATSSRWLERNVDAVLAELDRGF